ncbi:MAG: hypothetical protein IJG87_05870 [Ruminococcus sp.]|nr:hypothetical protein [Ruminococcus sp.]
MSKKEYSCPELTLVHFRLKDVILGSPEDFSSQINSGGWDLPPEEEEEL